MLSRLRAAARVFRPRALARTAKSVDDLTAETQQLRRAMKEALSESARLAERSEKLETTVRALEQSLAGVALREAQLAAVYRLDRELENEVAGLPAVLDLGTITRHTQRALTEAPLQLHPFPHIVVDNVWPEAFYDALLKGIPPPELFADRPINKRRMVVPFPWAHQYGARVWNFLVQEVLDAVVAPVLVQKFKQPLGEWLLANWPLPPDAPTDHVKFQSTDGRILLRHRGYLIPPHRDPKWGLITCLMYLARPGDSEAWGTQLYSVDGDVEAPSVAAYWIKAERCRFEKDVPFRRNSMLIFLNSAGAHGARIPADAEPEDLERYMYQFRIGPTASSIRELMRMLPGERQSLWAGKVTDYN
jgi:hypothetical protein